VVNDVPYGYSSDREVDRSTNRWMVAGIVLMLALAAAFPAYLAFEPEAREDSRLAQLESLETEGARTWEFNCASCHGADGEGGTAPALNSMQFLQEANDEQIELLVTVGVPGTAMGAFSQDFGGPLTSDQIRAVAIYLRSLEDEAPDNPDWREGAPE
jgi:mono/diheme cytochrome c family protein